MATTTYIVATLTGSWLVDASGRYTLPEIRRVHSRHRTLAGAVKARRKLAGYSTAPAILHGDGSPLSVSEQYEATAYSQGAQR